jgi:nitrile hydratase subunit alpha
MDDSQAAIRAEALESLLVEKGLLDPALVDDVIERYNERIGPMRGAALVARAWTDPEFKARLLADGSAAIAEYEFDGGQVDKLVVVANTEHVHNLVVCTLCSCYPWAVLGLPPKWYKDPAYRSRVVRQPRAVLSEFGTELDKHKRIRVWDSSAEVRYMVLPEMPAQWHGQSAESLAERVTRDSMIGVEVLGQLEGGSCG